MNNFARGNPKIARAKKFVEDPAFRFPIGKTLTKIRGRFKPGAKKLILEKI